MDNMSADGFAKQSTGTVFPQLLFITQSCYGEKINRLWKLEFPIISRRGLNPRN